MVARAAARADEEEGGVIRWISGKTIRHPDGFLGSASLIKTWHDGKKDMEDADERRLTGDPHAVAPIQRIPDHGPVGDR